ncbi:23S rRNA (adenine(2030)-N(6))-methyltransferase RlmJ [Pseudomonas rhizosphaerae]|jgi:23S rRNA (adenine2030-N6)-methyltransferase|uniref:23S rRNA (adenine(2030)-N(6))-methyltransferase RlmJ n=1 Tax=Pseudomonas rhizosphaerae TaxID=216142 RepID=UPI00177F00DE|nr:23S rRNA (adenine(2030)-N(6))-methyltransferase RlmJ [Pseudomonas rhizosphaerae]MBD8616127.1 23S rRNA (adenine(2030)-N(6))-methyltransferase RlmJ [Pseudomonas putida]MEB2870884.1 23S rRNA (adenine(2030)-N(6))-methyltransferase RlmJ [Pseudomonas rhizosphaerae]
MNYRHAFHAGNHADVFKHIVLTRLIALMSRKEQPFAYIDTHAGLGLYDLNGDQATRTGEWLEGIARLWQATDRPALTDDYVKVINRLNTEGELRYYPGSPELARRLMRQQDRVLLNEKHPQDGQLLKDNMKKDPRVAVHLGEGWHVPRALLPVAEKRAVMLIDPPFEQLDELQRCAKAMKETIGRMRQTVAAIWYPIKDDSRALKRFYQELTSSGAPKLLRVELLVHPLDTPQSLNGSGLVISNPPWGLEEELNTLMPWLANLLGQSQGGWKMDWLIAE